MPPTETSRSICRTWAAAGAAGKASAATKTVATSERVKGPPGRDAEIGRKIYCLSRLSERGPGTRAE
jgi:hypothetical protein